VDAQRETGKLKKHWKKREFAMKQEPAFISVVLPGKIGNIN